MKVNPLNYSISDINYLQPEKGRILISEPFMPDPYFKRSVVLLLEHDSKGSFGFILNKSMEFKLNNTILDFPDFDTFVYMGGPVQSDHLFFIHTKGEEIGGSIEVSPGLFWGGDFEKLKREISLGKIEQDEIRFFLGYAGWDSAQLEAEIKEESWIISESSSIDIFNLSPDELWRQSLLRIGGKCAQIANFPENPSYN